MIGYPTSARSADDVQNLVSDELVLEPQGAVEHTGLAQHDGVVQRPAQGEPPSTQHLDLLQEAKGPGRSDLVDEDVLAHPHRAGLVTQQRVIEADAVGDLELVGRIERDALVPTRQGDRTHDLEEPAGRGQRLDPGLVHQIHERRSAAVHDRHLGLVQLDDDVVDAQAEEGPRASAPPSRPRSRHARARWRSGYRRCAPHRPVSRARRGRVA